jgi:hypothetical protein
MNLNCQKNGECSAFQKIDCQTGGGCPLTLSNSSKPNGLAAISTKGKVLTHEEIYGKDVPYTPDILNNLDKL